MTHCACAILLASAVFELGLASHTTDLPPYMGVMVGPSRSSAGEIATKKVPVLNTGIFELYSDVAPVIFALFSGAGGRSILYRPSMAPLEGAPFIYLTCQNYILFSLAQSFGPAAINSRLILLETISVARLYGEWNG